MNRLFPLCFVVLALLALYPVSAGIGQTIPNVGVFLPFIAIPPATVAPTLTPTRTPTATSTVGPIATITPTATLATPIPTSTATATRVSVPTSTATSTGMLYECGFDSYNCSDFDTQLEAQEVFDYCVALGFGDIHRLDQNNDDVACESLP